MLKRYFGRDHVLRRIQENPICAQIKLLVEYLDGRGHPKSTVQAYVQGAEHFGSWLGKRRRKRRLINQDTVREFLDRHLSNCSCLAPAPKCSHSVRAALRHLLCAVAETSNANDQSSFDTPSNQLVEQYTDHLQTNCGLASATRQYRARYAREFLDYHFSKRPLTPSELTPNDVAKFVSDYAVRCKRSSAQVAASSLRSFLRFLHLRGMCDERLVRAVPSIPVWKFSSLPRVMTEDQLDRFLASFNRATPTGLRDYAMALSMIRLGLRVSEISELKLQDVNWRDGVIEIRVPKRRRSREVPLTRDVGSAIASYAKSGRPAASHDKAPCDGLFLRHTVPVGACVSRELVRGVIRRAYQRSDCPTIWTGTHVLRHTAATRLHQHGASLKEIADLLGHQSIDTSMIYTKVDLPTLGAVALPWPQEVQP